LQHFWESNKLKLLVSALAALGFAVWAAFRPLSYPIIGPWLDWAEAPRDYVTETSLFTAICFAALLGLGLWLASRHFDIEKHRLPLLVLGVGLAAGMVIRYMVLPEVSHDYKGFLYTWAEQFRAGGWGALTTTSSDYPMPYLYFIWLITRFPVPDLYLYKLGSVVFDVLLVLAALRLAARFDVTPWKKAVLAVIVFLVPTVILNGAFWGQCDVIYAFFCVMCLVYALEKRPVLCMVMAGLAFALKLQSIFFLPMLAVFWIAKKISWRHFPIFPAVYLAANLPALLSGVPIKKLWEVYMGQAGQYNDTLNWGSPSMYAILRWDKNNPEQMQFLFNLGIILAALFILAILALAWFRRKRLSDKALVFLSLCFAAGIPWLLPSMHSRYFFVADVLFVMAAVIWTRAWVIGPLQVYASYGAYYNYLRYWAYLYGRHLPRPLPDGIAMLFGGGHLAVHSLALLAALLIALYAAIRELFLRRIDPIETEAPPPCLN